MPSQAFGPILSANAMVYTDLHSDLERKQAMALRTPPVNLHAWFATCRMIPGQNEPSTRFNLS